MGKDLYISVLFDFYGDILTEKQQEVIDFYYNEDLSLAEISEHQHITRQGVRDSIKRAEAVLLEMEEKLGLAKRFRAVEDGLEQISQEARAIEQELLHGAAAWEIQKHTAEIVRLAETLNE